RRLCNRVAISGRYHSPRMCLAQEMQAPVGGAMASCGLEFLGSCLYAMLKGDTEDLGAVSHGSGMAALNKIPVDGALAAQSPLAGTEDAASGPPISGATP